MDLSASDKLDNILCKVRPDVVLHAAALANVDTCEQDPQRAHLLNVTTTALVAKAAQSAGARLIYLSSDQVFNGSSEWYGERDTPVPLNVYGRTKRMGELKILEHIPHALAIKANFFGWGPPHRPFLTDWVLAKLRASSIVRGFSDVFFAPILVNDLLERIESLLTLPASGILHIEGADRLSKLDFMKVLAREYGLPEELVQPSPVKEAGLAALRPLNMSLTFERLSSYLRSGPPRYRRTSPGYAGWSIEDGPQR